jgi:hypothetical protein
MKFLKKQQIFEYLFTIKKPLTQVLIFVSLVLLVTILRIGLTLQEQITGDDVFKIWMWAVSILGIVGIMILLYDSSEGFFIFTNGILIFLSMFDENLKFMEILILLVVIGLVGYVMYHLTNNFNEKIILMKGATNFSHIKNIKK